MKMLEDRRPTLASWPKRIFAWEELPEEFRPALEPWRRAGMPLGNITYIPRIRQGSGEAEHAVAWWGDAVLLQTSGRDGVVPVQITPKEVEGVDYQVQLLKVTLSLSLSGGRAAAFSYNKTREDQLLPVLNLLLGGAPDDAFPAVHPHTPELDRLLEDSYAMYHTALLCYRFGGELRAFLWLRGRERSPLFLLRRRSEPEYFLGATQRGLVTLLGCSYGTRAVYLRRERVAAIQARPDQGRLLVRAACGGETPIPVLPGQWEEGNAFLSRLAREERYPVDGIL